MAKNVLRGIIAVIGLVIISLIGVAIMEKTERGDIAFILVILLSTVFLSIVQRKELAEKLKENDSITLTKEEYENFCKISKSNDKFAK